jgi:hypothetical protein
MQLTSVSENSDFSSPFHVGDRSFWGMLRRLLWRSKLDVWVMTTMLCLNNAIMISHPSSSVFQLLESFAWPSRVSARQPPPISQWLSKSMPAAYAV